MSTLENQGEGADPIIDAGDGGDGGGVIVDDTETISIPKADYEKLNQTLGSLKREVKDLKKPKADPSETPSKKSETKSDDIDFGRLAWYNTRSDVTVKIEHPEDIDFLRSTVSETGKSLDDVLNARWFQSDLKDRIEKRVVQDAIPKGTRRSGESAKTTVDYWIGKGELPPNTPENATLRREVVNARYTREKSSSQFSSTPIVDNV